MQDSEMIKLIFHLHKIGISTRDIGWLVHLDTEEVENILFWRD